MTYSLMGLTVFAVALMLRKRLELEFCKRPFLLILALGGLLPAVVLEGFLFTGGDRDLAAFCYFFAAFGWLMFALALLSASGAFHADGTGPVDIAVEEYMAQREEKIRQEIRERFAERDAAQP